MQQLHSEVNFDLPFYETPLGTHYEIGYHVGSHFKERIQSFLQRKDLPFQSVYLPYINENLTIIQQWIAFSKKEFPNLVEEIKGLANGSQVPIEWIFSMNMFTELRNLMSNKTAEPSSALNIKPIQIINPTTNNTTEESTTENNTTTIINNKEEELPKYPPKECTDIFINILNGNQLLGHNEDHEKSMKEYAYIIKVNLKVLNSDNNLNNNNENNFTIRRFTAYCYPCILPGNTFGFNEHFCVTTNGEPPKFILLENGIPRYLLNRYILESNSLQNALERLKEKSLILASGFAANFVSLSTTTTNTTTSTSAAVQDTIVREKGLQVREMLNVEIAPSLDGIHPEISIHKIEPITLEDHCKNNNCEEGKKQQTFYAHCNSYLHLKVDQYEYPSSKFRMERANEFKVIVNEDGVKEFLGDEKNETFPIFRKQVPPDGSATLATAIFNFNENVLKIFIKNPKDLSLEPIHIISLENGNLKQ